MDFPKVTIQLVSWNSLKYLPGCLKSIFNQTYKDFQVLIIDNNSRDNTVEWVKNNYPEVTVFQNHKNFGFAKAHNQGIKLLNSPYVLVCNPDIILDLNWLENIMAEVDNERYRDYGLFGGKLLKLKVIDLEINDVEKTSVIDSCGLKLLKSRRVVELGSGEEGDKFNQQIDVFGHSGALALYRREALNNCVVKTKHNPQGEYFDEDFFFYKEDVDLAWRLQLLGWKSVFIPQAVAYHIRSFSGSENKKNLSIIRNRKKQSKLTRYYSYRNHFFLLLKNEFRKNFFTNFPFIVWQELKKFIYVLFFEWSSLKAISEVIKFYSRMRNKRKLIFRNIKVDADYIRKWIN